MRRVFRPVHGGLCRSGFQKPVPGGRKGRFRTDSSTSGNPEPMVSMVSENLRVGNSGQCHQFDEIERIVFHEKARLGKLSLPPANHEIAVIPHIPASRRQRPFSVAEDSRRCPIPLGPLFILTKAAWLQERPNARARLPPKRERNGFRFGISSRIASRPCGSEGTARPGAALLSSLSPFKDSGRG